MCGPGGDEKGNGLDAYFYVLNLPLSRFEEPGSKMIGRLILLILSVLAGFSTCTVSGADRAFGPLHHEFPLTLDSGHASESLGPLFGVERKGTQTLRRWTPLISRTDDPVGDFTEIDVAYPILTYDRFGEEFRFQFFQLFSVAGGKKDDETELDRFTLFPFYFQQRSNDTNQNYTALFPIYGKLKGRLFRDEARWVMAPLYLQSRKRDVVTDNYLFPFFHLRRGDDLEGWQLWPLIGNETKQISTKTNDWNEAQLVPGHRKFFAIWPFYFNDRLDEGTDNPIHNHNILPFVAMERSPLRDSTTVLWPFFTRTDDRGRKYKEWGLPWPLVVFARGEGKTANRIWPLFSRAYNDTQESRFYLWPLYKSNAITSDPLDRKKTRIMFFLYQALRQRDTGTGERMWRRDFWPLFTARRDWSGNERLQILAPLEPLLSSSDSIERNYSPIWSVWRAEKNPAKGAASQSLLWNLYRRDSSDSGRKVSLFFGLVQYESDAAGTRWKWLHFSSRNGAPSEEAADAASADAPKLEKSGDAAAADAQATQPRTTRWGSPIWRVKTRLLPGRAKPKTND